MKPLSTFKYDSLLLLVAIIWGFAFVAQRAGMEYVGPFIFNGIRFALGSLVLIPILIRNRYKARSKRPRRNNKNIAIAGILAGSVLFLGSSLQQVGIVFTSAGKAGFITGLYVILVPFLGLFLKQKTSSPGIWAGAIIATIGLYLLSIIGTFSISKGDFLVLVGALCWAIHVHVIGWFSPQVESTKLAFLQFTVCSFLSLLTSLLFEVTTFASIKSATIPIIYGGVFSIGIAFTMQVVAQKYSPPTHAAIIMSLEAVFAAVGGWLILNEGLSPRAIIGCALMLTGMIVSRLKIGKPATPIYAGTEFQEH